jgi:uncharacterized protein YkwD
LVLKRYVQRKLLNLVVANWNNSTICCKNIKRKNDV